MDDRETTSHKRRGTHKSLGNRVLRGRDEIHACNGVQWPFSQTRCKQSKVAMDCSAAVDWSAPAGQLDFFLACKPEAKRFTELPVTVCLPLP